MDQLVVHPPPIHTDSQSTVKFPMEDTAAQLPKLEIPVYAGEPLEWQSFWNYFEAVINTKPSLTGVQKLSYLCALLKSEPSRVVAALPLTNL